MSTVTEQFDILQSTCPLSLNSWCTTDYTSTSTKQFDILQSLRPLPLNSLIYYILHVHCHGRDINWHDVVSYSICRRCSLSHQPLLGKVSFLVMSVSLYHPVYVLARMKFMKHAQISLKLCQILLTVPDMWFSQ